MAVAASYAAVGSWMWGILVAADVAAVAAASFERAGHRSFRDAPFRVPYQDEACAAGDHMARTFQARPYAVDQEASYFGDRVLLVLP